MSHSWHAHWAEENFKPTRLQNWEVPRWHADWPVRHCTTTNFEAHSNGRLFVSFKRSKNPWSNFKGTWELPSKIDRRTAEELSRSTEYKRAFWRAHKKKHEHICKQENIDENEMKTKDKREDQKEEASQTDNDENIDKVFKEKCSIAHGCVL